ncbi:hypothetical protein DIPPA_19394 [Diplonema papillatum]|nr:hypothetical protein DIPPA_19394 [Diplonema papillatum]
MSYPLYRAGVRYEVDRGSDSDFASKLKQLSGYVHDNAAFTQWLRKKSVVLQGSLFWEKVSGIRFGGLTAAAYALTRVVGDKRMFEWALS